MTLLQRRLRLFWARYVAPGALERDPRFRGLLRAVTRQGIQVVGLVTAAAAVAYTAYRVGAGDVPRWNETPETTAGSVQVWDKAFLVAMGLGMVALGRARVGLRIGRLAVAAFILVATWFVVHHNASPDSLDMAAAWLTLLMVVAVGAVPFQPWQTAALGALMAAEFWVFGEAWAGRVGERHRIVFILLAAAIVAVVAGALYGSRYGQYRVLRRLARLKDQNAARSEALAHSLQRLRAAQAQLVQQEKLAGLGQLTAGIAHEIKNPLNFVTNFAQLSRDLALEVRDALTEDPDRPARAVAEELGEALDDLVLNTEKIAEHGRRADGIVKSMLAHSRATPGERRPVNLNRLLDEYANLAYHGMRAQYHLDVEVERHYDEALGELPIVPEEIGRVFLNLVGNAFDALRDRIAVEGDAFGPRVRITTRRTDDGAAVYVSDNGPGMPPEVLPRVFEPFFTTKPSGEGTGLGLSLAYEIVTQGHGGTLGVRSRVGEGTVFMLTLPARPPDIAEAVAEAAAVAPAAAEGDGVRIVTPPAEAV
jgi:signal transduction histidine kinase